MAKSKDSNRLILPMAKIITFSAVMIGITSMAGDQSFGAPYSVFVNDL